MPSYKVVVTVAGNNIKTITNQAKKVFGKDSAVDVTKLGSASSRAARLSTAESEIESAKSTIEELRDEMQNWYDNLPENLQQSSKAEEIQEAVDNLETILSDLENVDCSSVTFPGMY